MIIEDGAGTGYKSQVTNENMLKTLAITTEIQHHANHVFKKAFSFLTSVTPTGADDCFFFAQNTDSIDMVVTAIKLNAPTDETVVIKLGDIGTPVGGTSVTPACRNIIETADVVCEEGVDITGLTGGYIVDKIYVNGGTCTQKFTWRSGLIIPKNQFISLYSTIGGIAINATISIYFHTAS